MKDQDTVIKGLECIIGIEIKCRDCGYSVNKGGHSKCHQDCAKDAIALLKEQEKRINELEEKLRLLEYGDQDTLQSAMMPAT